MSTTDEPPIPPDDSENRPRPAKFGQKSSKGRAPVKDTVAAMLASGMTIRSTASKAGVAERTISRWLKEDGVFHSQVEHIRSEAVSRALRRLSASMTGAACTLRALLRSKDENVRHKAAKTILEVGIRLSEHTELLLRVADLEARLAGNGQN